MIEFTRFNDSKFYVNPELIETVEETPDTVVTLTTGRKFIIRESAAEVTDMIIDYKKKVFSELLVVSGK